MVISGLRVLAVLVLLSTIAISSVPFAAASPAQPTSISYWGMNAYLTKRERLATGDNLGALRAAALGTGARWTREELPWDLIEQRDDAFGGVYDVSLRQTADAGFGIIGMLLTTPAWARDPACSGNYWCPPANVNEYAEFAGWMAERYDGDGYMDAPGSPRIAAWELWNEPNAAETWYPLGPGGSVSRERYGQLMVAAFRAIKQADSSALVLTGGVYVYDGSYCDSNVCDGLNFLGKVFQQVPAARNAFDVLSIHPYIPTERPDAPNIPRLITVEGRVRHARAWLDASGRGDAPMWVTEMGWCTGPGACPGGVQVSEDQQANYLVRSLVIAQHNGVEHSSWFQLEDAFNNSGREWANAAILRNFDGSGYPAKPAYHAYRTLTDHLAKASVAGTGPVHTHVYDPRQPYLGSGGTYNYRYTRGSKIIDVLWRPTDAVNISFPVEPGKPVTLIDRDGAQTPLAPSNGVVNVTLSERPILIVQGEIAPRLTAPQSVGTLVQVGTSSAGTVVSIDNAGAGALAWTASTTTPWLSLSPANGATPSRMHVTANTRSLGVGRHTGTVTITAPSTGQTVTVEVHVVVVQSVSRAVLPLVSRQ